MADDDEIDVLGEFSFNSCFAQNNQGIPSCSNREDTVHPQWLLDSTATNWYDIQNKNLISDKKVHTEKGSKSKSIDRDNNIICTEWTQNERNTLVQEMKKYGRDVRKISQTIKTKTEAEIQALIEAEHGINLDTPTFGLDKNEDHEDVPAVVQEEIVTDDSPKTKSPKKQIARRKYTKSKKFKPMVLDNKSIGMDIDPGELVYEDDLMLGSTESIGSDLDLTDIVSKNIEKFQKAKAGRKMGNHRRKTSSSDRGRPRNKSKDLKSPQGRQRKDSSLSEDSMKSPKMHIVLGTGHSLPVSEGEQVIKIEKKKDSEPESDIEVDIDSDNESGATRSCSKNEVKTSEEAPIAVPLEGRKFEPMRKRAKKINLDGGGGYTIMHTDAGDLLELSSEPKKERAVRKPPVHLIQCRPYNADRPAPFEVHMYVSALISMDVHSHTSLAEVMGLLGGSFAPGVVGRAALTCVAYRGTRAAAGSTHCDMDPVSQSRAAESLRSAGLSVCAWHHSHPTFPANPSAQDLVTQRALQAALEWSHVPFLGIITSQHWATGRTASQYRCIRVEDDIDPDVEVPTGFQLSVKLVADLTLVSLPLYLEELAAVLTECERDGYSVDVARHTCPQARITYLDKCLSSISHHMRSAGYSDHDPVLPQLMQGLRDIFR